MILIKGRKRKKWEKSICWRLARCGQTQEVKLEFQQCRQSLDSSVRCCPFCSWCSLCCGEAEAVRWNPVAVNTFQSWLCIVNQDWFVNDMGKIVSWLKTRLIFHSLPLLLPLIATEKNNFPRLFDLSPVLTIINARDGRMNYVSAKNVHHSQRKNLTCNYTTVINSNTCYIESITFTQKSHYKLFQLEMFPFYWNMHRIVCFGFNCAWIELFHV